MLPNGPGGHPSAGVYPGPAIWALVHPHPQPALALQLAPNRLIPDSPAQQTSLRPTTSLPSHSIQHNSKFEVHFFVWCFAIEAWRARLANARATLLEDDEDDEVSIAMALGQLESAVHAELQPPMSVIGGSSVGKAKNLERARVIMDGRIH